MRFTALLVLACCALASRPAAASARHLRFSTAHGPIHVYVPDGYDRAHAGTVIYVHGFFANVDEAWRRYKLADQFAASRINALFIACEAPTAGDEPVAWASLGDLLATVREHLAEPLPPGPIVAVGHSGAHITLRGWLDEPQLDTIVLLDALYGEVAELAAWLDASDQHRLIDVAGGETREWTEQLHAQFPESLVLDGLPERIERTRSARLVYIRANVDHMEVITGGVVLPKVLRALRLPEIAHAATL
jgi:hypothetical protein